MSGPGLANERTRSHVFSTPASGSLVLVLWDGGSVMRALAPGARVVIGRGDECDLQVLHGSVSRRHAEIASGPPPSVVDLGSANGTRVRGRPLARGVAVPIAFGEAVELGGAVLVVQPGRDGTQLPSASPPSPGGAMEQVRHITKLVAPTSMAVLLLGETGVGKEVTAAALHAASTRASGPFVRVNCAALSEALLESELFGHERGAFTGAHSAKEGLLEAADGGTMFLDEVGELTLTLQAKLLRVLEDGEVRRVGATRGRAVDVRFIAATNRDLPVDVQAGSFRSDLYFRLNGMTIRIPPLRCRLDELPSLAAKLLANAYARVHAAPQPLAPDALARLGSYAWPGNVRELRNVLERAVVLAASGPVRPEHLVFEAPLGAPAPEPSAPFAPTSGAAAPCSAPAPLPVTEELPRQLERLERERIEQALTQTGGNQTLAARLLGITRRQLIARIEQYGLPRPRKKGCTPS